MDLAQQKPARRRLIVAANASRKPSGRTRRLLTLEGVSRTRRPARMPANARLFTASPPLRPARDEWPVRPCLRPRGRQRDAHLEQLTSGTNPTGPFPRLLFPVSHSVGYRRPHGRRPRSPRGAVLRARRRAGAPATRRPCGRCARGARTRRPLRCVDRAAAPPSPSVPRRRDSPRTRERASPPTLPSISSASARSRTLRARICRDAEIVRHERRGTVPDGSGLARFYGADVPSTRGGCWRYSYGPDAVWSISHARPREGRHLLLGSVRLECPEVPGGLATACATSVSGRRSRPRDPGHRCSCYVNVESATPRPPR